MLDPLDLDAVNVDQPRGIFVPSICDWAQDSTSVTLFFPLGPAIRARDVQVQIKAAHLQVLQRVAAAQGGGNRVILAGPLFARCDPTESEWELEAGELRVTLRKVLQREWAVPLQIEASNTPDVTDGKGTSSSPGAMPAPPSKPATSQVRPPVAPPPPVPLQAAAAPGKEPAASAQLADAYAAWDRFDDVGALMSVENQGKSTDEAGFSVRTTPASQGGVGTKAMPGVAAIQCTDYVKDREEISLDEDLASSVRGLNMNSSLETPWPLCRHLSDSTRAASRHPAASRPSRLSPCTRHLHAHVISMHRVCLRTVVAFWPPLGSHLAAPAPN